MSQTLYLENNTLQSGNGEGPPGSEPNAVGYDSHANEIDVADTNSETLSVISDSTNSMLANIPLAGEPGGVVSIPGTSEVYVAINLIPCPAGVICNPLGGPVQVISDATDQVTANLQLGGYPSGVVYDSSKNEVFVTDVPADNVSVLDAATNQVVAAVPVGTSPSGIAYDPTQGEVFEANYESDNVTVISDADNKVIANVDVGYGPVAVAYDGSSGLVFVANSGSNNVSVISATTNTVVKTLHVGQYPDGIADDAGKAEVFVDNFNSNNLSVISTTSDQVIANLGAGASPSGSAYDSGKSEIFTAFAPSGNVSVISDATDASVATVPLEPAPEAAVYDSGKDEIFVGGSNLYSPGATFNCLCIVSGSTNQVTVSIPVAAPPTSLAYDSGMGEVFATGISPDAVSVFSDATNTDTTSVALGETAGPLVYDSAKDEIFVIAGSEQVKVISDASNSVTGTIDVGSYPDALAYDPTAGEVFVGNADSDNLSVISDSTDQVTATVPLKVSPQSLAYDSVTNELWVAAQSVTCPGCPPPAPGSVTGNVSVYSASTHQELWNDTLGYDALQVTFDAGTGEAFVSDREGGDVAVFSDAPDAILADYASGSGPEGMAYDSTNGDVYVANDFQGTLSLLTFGGPIPPPTVSQLSFYPTPGTVGSTESLAATARGGTDVFSWDWTGLPSGCLSENIGYFTCTPTTAGTFPVRVYANDTDGQSATDLADLVVDPASAGGITISSFYATPTSLTEGSTTTLTVDASGGTGALSYDYTGLPPGCSSSDTSSLSCSPSAIGDYVVRVYVNDTASDSANLALALLVTAGPPAISTFTSSPSSLAPGWTTFLNVTASGGTGTLSYAYAGLPPGCSSSDRASLNCVPTGAGVFTVRVYVNDSLSESATSTAKVTVVTAWIASVSITPLSNANELVGQSYLLTAVASCSSSCPGTGIGYAWSDNHPSLGSVSWPTGATNNTATFTAGATPGMLSLFVNATLDGRTVQSSAFVITISVPLTNTPATLLGLPESEALALIAAIIVGVVVTLLAVILLARRKRSPPDQSPPPPATYDGPGMAPPSEPSGWPPQGAPYGGPPAEWDSPAPEYVPAGPPQ